MHILFMNILAYKNPIAVITDRMLRRDAKAVSLFVLIDRKTSPRTVF